MSINVNQNQEIGISPCEKQNFQEYQNPPIDTNTNSSSYECVELKLVKLGSHHLTRMKSTDMYDFEDPIQSDFTFSNCGSPDTQMESVSSRVNYTKINQNNQNHGFEQNTLKISQLNQNPVQDVFISNDTLRKKLLNSNLLLSKTSTNTKESISGHDFQLNDIGVSPFNFEHIQRFSCYQEKMKLQKLDIYSNNSNSQFKLLDEVLEEELGIQGRLNSDLTDESLNKQNEYLQIDEKQKRGQEGHVLQRTFSPIIHKNENGYFHSNSSNNVFFNGVYNAHLIRNISSPNQYDEMQERIFKFFDIENIQSQAVGEALSDINSSSIKNLSKQMSPIKLDMSRSPLRRLRANTIQL